MGTTEGIVEDSFNKIIDAELIHHNFEDGETSITPKESSTLFNNDLNHHSNLFEEENGKAREINENQKRTIDLAANLYMIASVYSKKEETKKDGEETA